MGLQSYLEAHGRAGRVLLVFAVALFFGVSCCAWHEYGHLIAARILGVSAEIFSTALNQTPPDVYDWRIVPIAYSGGALVAVCLFFLDALIDVPEWELGLRPVAVIEAVYGVAEGTWFLAWYMGWLEGHLWWTANGLSAGAALGGAVATASLLIELWRRGWLRPD